MDESDDARAESSSTEAAEKTAGVDQSPMCAEPTHGCSHYQRKCSLVV